MDENQQNATLTDTELMRSITESLIADGQPHRASELYEKFVEQTGGTGVRGKEISRKVYESFLRQEIIRNSGSLKRTGFGIYQKRSHPNDRGIAPSSRTQTNPRFAKPTSFDECDDAIFQGIVSANCRDDLYELLDKTYELTGKLKIVLDAMCTLPGSEDEQSEMRSIREVTMENLDTAITGITCAIAWREGLDEDLGKNQTDEDQAMNPDEMTGPIMQM